MLARSANIPDAGPIDGPVPGPRPRVDTVEAPDDQELEEFRLWAVTTPTPTAR